MRKLYLYITVFFITLTLQAQNTLSDSSGLILADYQINQISAEQEPPIITPVASTSANSILRYIPTSYSIDISKSVGEIPYSMNVGQGGNLNIVIPINLYENPRGFTPEVSLVYTSASTHKGIMGPGWSIGGTSMITRGNKSIYYDGYTEGQTIYSTNSGTKKADLTFLLDGMRLIHTGTSSTTRSYETEEGNIKVIGYCTSTSSGTSLMIEDYFEVFYPDGRKATYGFKGNNKDIDRIFYPIVEITDRPGNKIKYSYSLEDNVYLLEEITYGEDQEIAVDFTYNYNVYSSIEESYIAGQKISHSSLLYSIRTRFNDQFFGHYDMTYDTELENSTPLKKISYSANSKTSVNPLIFYYGEKVSTLYPDEKQKLKRFISFTNPSEVRIVKGKFEYSSESDGIIMLPNKLSSYEYRVGSSKSIVSEYRPTDKIVVIPELNVIPEMDPIIADFGFEDILCANVDGRDRESIIKINNTIEGNYDKVQIGIYATDKSSPYSLKEKNLHVFRFSTLLTHENIKSINPKQYFTGDFTGNGKSEMLIVTAYNALDKGANTMCYLIDLETGKTLYQGSPFKFLIKLPVMTWNEKKDKLETTVSVEEARNSSYKLYPVDYDGDGKTDFCMIDDSGMHIYTFRKSTSGYSLEKIKSNTDLKNSNLAYKEIYMGEFNGDGKSDLLLSPYETSIDTTWTIYLSKGDGSFETKKIGLMKKSHMKDIVIQDVNLDGHTDISFRCTMWDNSGFMRTILIKDAQRRGERILLSSMSSPGKLFPADLHNHANYSISLCLFGDGTLYRLGSNLQHAPKSDLISGVISSHGVITKIAYAQIKESEFYNKGTDAVFPYVNHTGGIFTVSDMLSYYNDELLSHTKYKYKNAVIHKQGLGFRGFGEITHTEQLTSKSYKQTFAPYQYGVLLKDESEMHANGYTYSHTVANNKTRKSRLARITSYDLLTGTRTVTSYEYDTYGNPTKETVDYSDNSNKVITTNIYTNNTSTSNYRLGLLTNQQVETHRDGTYMSKQKAITYNGNYLPLTIKDSIEKNTLMAIETYKYDSKSNLIESKIKKYASTKEFTNTYTYDSWGRIKKKTNPMGQSTEYTYNKEGLLEKVTDYKKNVTSYTYNDWRDIAKIKYPDGTETNYTTRWISNGPDNAIYLTSETNSDQSEQEVYYDALGRTVRVGEKRFDGVFLYVDTQYDQQGRVLRRSEPSRDYPPFIWQSYTYDDYDRIISKSSNIGTVTYSYNKLQQTTTINGVNYVKTYDAAGFLTKASDPGGDITYTYRPDGQISATTAPGNLKTTFTYDAYGRKYNITDPSAGMHQFRYNNDGQVRLIALPTGKTTHMEYDDYGRITRKNFNGDVSSIYTYHDSDGTLTSIVGSNGTKVEYTYDNYLRVIREKETIGHYYFTQEYEYTNGHLKSISYYSDFLPYSRMGKEEYKYTNGHLTEILFNPGQISPTTTVWKLTQESPTGHLMKELINTNEASYTRYTDGLPGKQTLTRNGIDYNHAYNFQVHTRNLTSRTDTRRNREEKFEYDNLDRLTKMTTGIKNGSSKAYTLSYNTQGTRTKHTGIGTYTANPTIPYQTTKITPIDNKLVTNDTREITYNSLNLPATIKQGSFEAVFEYNYNKQRSKMVVKEKAANGTDKSVTTKIYFGNKFEIETKTGEKDKRRLYIGGDCYSAPGVYTTENITGTTYYLWRDHLGSITHIMNSKEIKEQSYDPWGLLRNPENQEIYQAGNEPELFLGRGYTGHEHLPWFGLINMNARLYDPALGSFISPDPYVQAPDFTQNFNRYSYCLNNPLKYVDPDGEIAWFTPLLIGAGIFATGNTVAHAIKGDIKSWGDGFKYFSQGAITGALLGGIWQFSPYIPYVGPHIQNTMNLYGITQIGSTIAGFTFGAFNDGGKGMKNAAKTFLGNFYLDENSFFGGILQGFSRHTWEFPQTAVGYGYTQARNIFGKVDRIDYFGGATFATQEYSDKNDGISIGNYININIRGNIDKNFNDWVLSEPLYMHEYGHTMDSRLFGPTYLFAVGIPSIFSANNSHKLENGMYSHRIYWTETRANRKAAKYFKRHFGIDWDFPLYPLKK